MCVQGVGADPHTALALPPDAKLAKEEEPMFSTPDPEEMTIRIGRGGPLSGKPPFIYHHHLHCPAPHFRLTGILIGWFE